MVLYLHTTYFLWTIHGYQYVLLASYKPKDASNISLYKTDNRSMKEQLLNAMFTLWTFPVTNRRCDKNSWRMSEFITLKMFLTKLVWKCVRMYILNVDRCHVGRQIWQWHTNVLGFKKSQHSEYLSPILIFLMCRSAEYCQWVTIANLASR